MIRGRWVVMLVAGTLVWFGWQLYSVDERQTVISTNKLMDQVREYNETNVVPARLYSDKVLLRVAGGEDREVVKVKRTDRLADNFSVYQEFKAERDNLACIDLAIESNRSGSDPVTMRLLERESRRVVREWVIQPAEITDAGRQAFCFEPIADSAGRDYLLSLLVSGRGGDVSLFYEEGEGLYMVRVVEPTTEQMAKSRKSAGLVMEAQYGPEVSEEQMLVMRHLNATVGASGARWIGSISIRRYRDFVKGLFANDKGTVGGDGKHILARNRKLFDMAGVTHFAQALDRGATDAMLANGFSLLAGEKVRGVDYVMYRNEQALPRAYVVPLAEVINDRESVFKLLQQEEYDPRQLIYIEDIDNVLDEAVFSGESLQAEVVVGRYEPTRVDMQVTTDKPAWLVLTDSFVPMWQLYIDGEKAPRFVGNQLWRVARVPVGQHTVSWQYESVAVGRAIKLTGGGGLIVVLVFAWRALSMRNWQHGKSAI